METEDKLVLDKNLRKPASNVFYIDVNNIPVGESEKFAKELLKKYQGTPVNNYEKKGV